MSGTPIRIMGIDVAWTGQDDSGYVIRCGNAIEDIDRWHGYDITMTSERCTQRILESKDSDRKINAAVVDIIGYGAGVYSNMLRDLRGKSISIYGCDVKEATLNEGYNRFGGWRDKLWWRAKTFFRDQSPYFLVRNAMMEQLCNELRWVRLKPKSLGARGKVEIESKDDIRKRHKASPDSAEMLVLTFFADYKIIEKNSEPEPYWKKILRQKRGAGAEKSFMLV